MSLFTITLAGRPNVGKSTLFNLLSKKKLAIVEDTPGVTIDYKENNIELFNTQVKIVDTGGITTTKINKKEPSVLNHNLNQEINEQALVAIKKSTVVLFVVDGKEGLTLEDKEIATVLRKIHDNIIIVINKVDNNKNSYNHIEFKTLGFNKIVEMSAIHKTGLQNLYKTVEHFFKIYKLTTVNEESANANYTPPFLSITIVGKPNTGKSTLINSLLKEKRLVVSDIAGTTKDSISVYFNYNNKLIRVIDTAGLVRKSKVKKGVDTLAKSETIRSIIFAQVVILIIDSIEGITKQDLTLASYVLKEGRALIIALNKIDLVSNPDKLKKEIIETLNTSFSDVKGISIISISALKKINLNKIFKESLLVYSKWSISIKTSLLNRWLRDSITNNPPALYNGRQVKIKFISQEKTRPPTFNLWVNLRSGIYKQYLTFLRNQIYKTFSLWGVPIKFNIKTSKNPYINT